MADPSQLTERQRKWFATVRQGLETKTGRTMEQWAELARACPETAHRKRLAWMKAEHGLGQNHASLVLEAAFPPGASWSTPQDLAGILWSDPQQRATLDAITAAATALPGVVVGQRRSFTAFSRNFQFAAARPAKGAVLLGFALDPGVDARLASARRESWSERLKSTLTLDCPAAVDADIENLLRMAWEAS